MPCKKATASVSPPSQAFTICKPLFVAVPPAQKGAICALRYIESLATEKWAGVTRHRRQGITRGNILLEWWAMLLCYFRSLRVCTFCLDLAPILNLINEDNGTFHGSIDLIACTDGKNIIGSPISRRRAQLELSVLLSKGTKMYQGKYFSNLVLHGVKVNAYCRTAFLACGPIQSHSTEIG